MKFSHLLLIATAFIFGALLAPVAEHRTFASSCSGEIAKSCGGERSFRTPVRTTLEKKPLRSVLVKKSCSGS